MTDVATVVQIAQLFEPSRFEAVGLVNHDQIWWSRAPLRVGVAAESSRNCTH
jgi:hypothetical protein